ncbi:alternate-type signal peptide domain-containing protein [Promicromonospora panici]|uniref:alternate-type signal peptide domain-containing protein n=1 Tax=Promicromonospora panici TaxID=2219658 RepID=UPI00101CB4EF|nr:alternate-type signal peptide domain-containing protein [Promicromonospora panici]
MAETRRSSRATKALVAAAVAGLLLAAGGGTFARWYDAAPVPQQTFTSGTLTIDAATGTWTDSGGTAVANPTAHLIIPGTTLTYTTTVDVKVEGAGLTGLLTTDFSGIAGTTELASVLQVGLTLDGVAIPVEGSGTSTKVTASKTYTLVLTVKFPGQRADGSSWGTYAQGSTADLTAFKLSLTQAAAS